MPTEADTCRMYVVPLLQAAGWDAEPCSIAEQRSITDGRIIPVGQRFVRRPPKRIQRLKQLRPDFFACFGPEARQVLEELLEKYARHGDAQFVLPDVLKTPPISEHGTINDIIDTFGGADKLREAVDQLQALLYVA